MDHVKLCFKQYQILMGVNTILQILQLAKDQMITLL